MLNLIIFGTPGAGKGTQAEMIARTYELTHISTGNILREEIQRGSLGEEVKSYIDRGELVPDDLVISIIEKAISEDSKGNGFIFDGFPRTLHQAESLQESLEKNNLKLNAVLSLELSEQEAIDRILLRGRTSGRSDDTTETVSKRFQTYHKITEPLLEYYDQQGIIIKIDGAPDIQTVSENILKTIDAIKKDI